MNWGDMPITDIEKVFNESVPPPPIEPIAQTAPPPQQQNPLLNGDLYNILGLLRGNNNDTGENSESGTMSDKILPILIQYLMQSKK